MKERLDSAIVARGLVSGRDRAKGVIMAGQVYVNGQKADKPGQQVSPEDRIEVRGEQLPYVSRGGLKLQRALEVFALDLEGAVCGDFGASTGGFTDCMLQRGAAKVYAVDVGYGQLAWDLRQDPRVVSLERTNVRYLTKEVIPQALDFISVDVSFISLRLVLPTAYALGSGQCKVVCLVKPQFEAGRELVGKKGVVRDPATHGLVLEQTLTFAREAGFYPWGLTYSPVKGPEGNIEYLLLLGKTPPGEPSHPDIAGVVEASHRALDQ